MNDSQRLLKSILGNQGYDTLEKAIYKQTTAAVVDPLEFYLPLLVVPRAILSWLVQNIKPMNLGEKKEINFPGRDDIKIYIDKQGTDQYRAEFVSGGKIIHSFEKQSLPAVSGHFMTVGEMYESFAEPKDEPKLESKESPQKSGEKEPEAPQAFDMVRHMMSVSNIQPKSDPENVKWEMSHANVRELTAVIGKLIDAFTAKQISRETLENELDKETSEDSQEKQESDMKTQKKNKDLKKEAMPTNAVDSNDAPHPKPKITPESAARVDEPSKQSLPKTLNKEAMPTQKTTPPEKPKVVPASQARVDEPSKQSLPKNLNKQVMAPSAPPLAPSPKISLPGPTPIPSSAPTLAKDYFNKKMEILRKPPVMNIGKAAMDEKGVHEQYNVEDKNTPGRSLAGALVREKQPKHAVTEHKAKLDQLKQMPKPNLPKSEDMQKEEKGVHAPRGTSPNRQGSSKLSQLGWGKDDANRPEARAEANKKLSELKQMPKPNLPKSEILMDKAEMPKGAGQPVGPKPPQMPKPPVPAGHNPAASASKQAQSSGKGGQTMPHTPGAAKPKNPSSAGKPLAAPKMPGMPKPPKPPGMMGKEELAMEKARFEESHHDATKRSIRSSRHESNAVTPRLSPVQGIAAKAGQFDRAKQEAMGNLKTIQSMPKPNLPGSNYFKNKLNKPIQKSYTATEEQLYKSNCLDCGRPEFTKGKTGHPVFTPCACFLALKKDEDGQPTTFVNTIRKSDGSFSLDFDKNADPEAIKIFLLTLKSQWLLKKKYGL